MTDGKPKPGDREAWAEDAAKNPDDLDPPLGRAGGTSKDEESWAEDAAKNPDDLDPPER